ncbi:serine/threonine protein kinase, partial [Methanoculleus bourgensis]
MRPERAGRGARAAVLILLAALFLVAASPIVSGAGGPPEHANADPRGIEAAGKTPNLDTDTNPGKNTGQKKDRVTPEATPTPEETVTPDISQTETPEATPTTEETITPVDPQTETPDMGAAADKNPGQGRQGAASDRLPWFDILLIILLLVSGTAALAWYLKRLPGEETASAATILPGAYQTIPSHP